MPHKRGNRIFVSMFRISLFTPLLAIWVLFSQYTQSQQTVTVTKSKTAQRFDALGLLNLKELDSTIAVHLLYATPDNFLGEIEIVHQL